eukprot:TRINITY_DN9804_c0_g3_i1.p1 TRINITY_DN9804_c0_g3~~TRINITY_DN9804_c0_g3_i1.p1  ORF type:complete len:320 (+),score=44.82 TRINITY_DN9804_c0_g3_i1:85-1044(+)
MPSSQQIKLILTIVCALAVLMVVSQGSGAGLVNTIYQESAKKSVKTIKISMPPSSTAEKYFKTHSMEHMVGAIVQGTVNVKPADPVRFLRESLGNVSTPKIIIAGPPAGGKGTQCEMLVKTFNFVHISTGDLLRSEVRSKSSLGTTAQSYMTKGQLVPDELVIEMLLQRMSKDDVREHGWLLDGFPRTVNQARAMIKEGIVSDGIVLLNVPDDVVSQRITGRRTDPETGAVYHLTFKPPPPEVKSRLLQRSDDTVDAIKERLVAYHKNLNPLLTSFTCPIHRIEAGNLPPDVVFPMITEAIQSARWTKLAMQMGISGVL